MVTAEGVGGFGAANVANADAMSRDHKASRNKANYSDAGFMRVACKPRSGAAVREKLI